MEPPWDAYFALARLTIGPAGSAHHGSGWFALVSGEASAELNICGLTIGASVAAVDELLRALGPDLPAIVFRSQFADAGTTARLEELGFGTAEAPEPLMVASRAPEPAATAFRIQRAVEEEISHGIAIAAEAHAVDRDMLDRTLALAPRDASQLWLAWDGGEPVSAVWLLFDGDAIAVWSMMTPARHQRRGGGRALLTAALARAWTPQTRFAVLVATPAGRRLYESIGFVAVDEVTTSFRGMDEELLEAIGQATPRTD